MQLKLFFMYFLFFFFFFFSFILKFNCRVFTQWPLTFLPVSCRIDVGHSDYGYQQPSYPEQGYDRPYEDSSPHYYEGGIYIPSHTDTCTPLSRNAVLAQDSVSHAELLESTSCWLSGKLQGLRTTLQILRM